MKTNQMANRTVSMIICSMLIAIMLIMSGCSTSPAVSDADSNGVEKTTLSVSYWKAGWGDDWFKKLKTEFEKENPDVIVELLPDADITNKIGAKLETGIKLPDVAFIAQCFWQQWAAQGMLADLSDLYSGNTFDEDGTFYEDMEPSALSSASYLGKYWTVPWSTGALSFVYNVGMFEENGWIAPKTWQEFTDLCEMIKAKGIAPIAYSGTSGSGYLDFIMRTWTVQKAGIAYERSFAKMESPEIYKNPARLDSFNAFEDLFKNKWTLEGCEGLNHTQSQMEFLNGKAAMMPNGYWLANEMKNVTPEGFKMKMMAVPALEGSVDPEAVYVLIGDNIIVPAKSKNTQLAKEFLRFASSNEMCRQAIVLAGGFRPFEYNVEGLQLSEFSQSVYDLMKNGKTFSFANDNALYSKFGFYPSGNPCNTILYEERNSQEQYDADYNFAVSKWDEFKDEIGME
ncbi:MAG: extracellular solute-binding protein [Saccharofermentanales bacterium]